MFGKEEDKRLPDSTNLLTLSAVGHLTNMLSEMIDEGVHEELTQGNDAFHLQIKKMNSLPM
jgi:hypothetical protein